MKNYYVKRNKKLYGPLDFSQVANCINLGIFSEQNEISDDKITWISIEEMYQRLNEIKAPYQTKETPNLRSVPDTPMQTITENKIPYPTPQAMSCSSDINMFTALKKYADFSGRASRKEYWLYVLFKVIIWVAISMIQIIISKEIYNIVSTIGFIGFFLPDIAVQVRRLHDTGRSGWWTLICLIPLLGLILLVFNFEKSQDGTNQYGDNPYDI